MKPRDSIGAGELHVWRVALGGNRDAARRALRGVLSEYLDEGPESIALGAGERGKPQLADPDAALRFNLSHSGEVALVAIAWEREVGVDVERVAPRKDLLGLARRALAPEEAARIESLPSDERPPAFYAAWTRREAVAKCHGGGLGAPLPEAPVAVANLDIAPGCAAALAVAGEALPPRLIARPAERFDMSKSRP